MSGSGASFARRPELFTRLLTEPTATAFSAVLKMANKSVFVIIGVTLWAMGSSAPFGTRAVSGTVVTAAHQPKMVWVYASRVITDVVNGGFICASEFSGERNITNKKLIGEPMRFELPFIVLPEAFDNDAVANTVKRSGPKPTTVFGESYSFCESVNQWGGNTSSWHSDKKNPARQLEVKSAHAEPQPKDGLVNGVARLSHFKADQSLTETQKEAS